MKAINAKAFIDRDLIQMRNGARMTDAATTSREPWMPSTRAATFGPLHRTLPAVSTRATFGSRRMV